MRGILPLVLLIMLLVLAGTAGFQTGLLALALPLVVYLLAAAWFAPPQPRLQVERWVESQRAAPGQPLQMQVRLRNQGRGLEEVLVMDELPAGAQLLSGQAHLLTALPPGKEIELCYTLRLGRGFHPLQGVKVEAREHQGIWHSLETGLAPENLVILPQPGPLKRVAIRPQHTRLAQGSILARSGGPGTDFFGVRGYASGDSLRRINWRASARREEILFTNEFEQERAADVGLILDARGRVDVSSREASLFENAVEAAATLAETLLRAGNRVGLLVYGGLLDWTFPGYGNLQRERILQALAAAKTAENLIFDRIEYLPRRVFPPRSQIVLVSPLHPDDLPFLVRLRALGYALSVISPDGVAFEAARLRQPPSPDLALGLRLARLERTLLLNGLRQAGVQVLDWNVATPFEEAAGVALSRRYASL
jgi:uncharacterized protein (DUF58 family)